MIRALLAGALAGGVLLALSAAAQDDPIASRKALMKQVGAATGLGTKYVKGEEAFDLAKAREILQVYATAADKTHTYFPPTSKAGGQTTAAPAIWESQADFRAKFDAWARDIEKAKAGTKDLDSFKAEFTTLTRACGSCHQTYRVRA